MTTDAKAATFAANLQFETRVRYAMATLKDGTGVEVEYILAIDWNDVRGVVEKAVRNKYRRSRSGPVRVRAIAITKGTTGGLTSREVF